MPIIDIQKRLHEVGRIRLGEQVATQNGKTRPAKLTKFRFTSADEVAIKAVSSIYGGEIRPWEGAAVGESWELYTDSSALDVLVPHIELAWSQWMENWSGAVCRNRCDGQTDVKNDAPCACDPDNTICKPTSRLGVILSDIDGIGIWRVESHGWNAAQELGGTIDVIRGLQASGIPMVPARLLLKQRQQKKEGANGKIETFNFSVPSLDLKVSVAGIMSGNATSHQLSSGVTPIQQEPAALPSVAEQAAIVNTPRERPKRANSPAPLPATGLKPRSVSIVATTQEVETPQEPSSSPASTPATTAGGASKRSYNRLWALIRGNKTIPEDDDGRHAWARLALGLADDAPISFGALAQSDINKLMDVAEGKSPLISDEPPF